MMKYALGILVLVVGVFAPASIWAQQNTDPFPRLASVNYGPPMDFERAQYQKDLARVSVVFLQYWPGWEQGRRMNMEQVVQSIKRENPKTRVFLYINSNEVAMDSVVWSDIVNWLNRNNGWLYLNGTTGEPLRSSWVPQTYRAINNSIHGPKDSTGRNFVEWYADWVLEKYYRPHPSIDGFFMDNVMTANPVRGDWNRDGQTDASSGADPSRWLRQGYVQHFQRTEKAMPGKFLMGNVVTWAAASTPTPEYMNLLHGGLFEHAIGETWSPESSATGFRDVLQRYRKKMSMLKPPKLLVFDQLGDVTDYQAFRYGLGISLLDDGYYSFTDRKKGFHGVHWFDEFDVRLGAATSPPPASAWQKGIWRRDFENGVVLVNPKGNGAVELDLGAEFRRVSGKQAPSVNSGGVAGKVRLADRDGIILLRASARARPQAPKGLSVQ